MEYTDTNEWIQQKGAVIRVGISKKALGELGEIVYISLPEVGAQLDKGDEAVVMESTKAATDSYSPVRGIVKRVNAELLQSLDLLNQDPEGKGWLYEIEVSGEDS